ncbi:MFS transporter [Streptomyces sp. NPDC059070]|uniref:MFS transporter n=1 Tax=Streptomyces sp. NPDC059070 TaxID=3346713 RepID=UPI0036AA5E5E
MTASPTTGRQGPVLAQPYVARLLAGTLLGRLPTGMVPVSMLLLVGAQGGSLSTAGMLCAAYGLASALGQPLLGRLVDRNGQTLVTTIAVLVTTLALLTLPHLNSTNTPALFAAVVVLAGLATPPLEANLRALWPSVLPDPSRQRAALALDTGSQGLIFITGPPLVAALTALTSPALTLTATALLGLTGATAVLTAPPSRAWQPHTSSNRSGFLGPLQHRGLVVLFIAVAGTGVALGAHTVWAVALADRTSTPLLSGLIPAALSVGSLIGGALYGRRTWPGSLTTHLSSAALAFALGWSALITRPGPAVAVGVSVLPGLFLTALVTSSFLTVDALAPAGTTTEAYAWLIASIGIGQATGTALAGPLATHPHLAGALPCAGALFTVTVLALARRRIYVPGAPVRRGRHRRTPAHAASRHIPQPV